MSNSDQAIFYKLTDSEDISGRAYKVTQWGDDVTHHVVGEGLLGLGGWLYAYDHPLKAPLFNSFDGYYDLESAHLWECRVEGRRISDVWKHGFQSVTTLRRVPLPQISAVAAVRFAIELARETLDEIVSEDRSVDYWKTWARFWLDGSNRDQDHARVAFSIPLPEFARIAVLSAILLRGPSPLASAHAREEVARSVIFSLRMWEDYRKGTDAKFIPLLEECIQQEKQLESVAAGNASVENASTEAQS